jgi:hypothetical protein
MNMTSTSALAGHDGSPLRRRHVMSPTRALRVSVVAGLLLAGGCFAPNLAVQPADSLSIKQNGPTSFIFDASSVRHSAKPALQIRLGERITRQALKRRFAGYDVRYSKGEGCLTCAVITGADGQFDVDFDHDGRTVIHVRSTDDRVRDTKGNGVGAPLSAAIGSNAAQCDAGESTTCASPDLNGLLYIVTDDERCTLNVEEKKSTVIPFCARIGGFQIALPDKSQ